MRIRQGMVSNIAEEQKCRPIWPYGWGGTVMENLWIGTITLQTFVLSYPWPTDHLIWWEETLRRSEPLCQSQWQWKGSKTLPPGSRISVGCQNPSRLRHCMELTGWKNIIHIILFTPLEDAGQEIQPAHLMHNTNRPLQLPISVFQTQTLPISKHAYDILLPLPRRQPLSYYPPFATGNPHFCAQRAKHIHVIVHDCLVLFDNPLVLKSYTSYISTTSKLHADSVPPTTGLDSSKDALCLKKGSVLHEYHLLWLQKTT